MGPADTGAGARGGWFEAEALDISGWPHVTQKRRPRWLTLPQTVHRETSVAAAAGEADAGGGAPTFGASVAVGEMPARDENTKSGA